jgi:hypothetical protein
MKRILSSIAATVVLFAVVACGSPQTEQSSFMNRSEPDFKTKDGQGITDWVKKNENKKAVCDVLRSAKQNGNGPTSSAATQLVSQRFELHPAEAEIVALYAVEFGCPELQ